jgi:hypothetical protein
LKKAGRRREEGGKKAPSDGGVEGTDGKETDVILQDKT